MNQNDVFRWQSGFLAARREERRLIRHEGVNSERSIRLALALIEAARQQHKQKTVFSADPTRERNVNNARDRWRQLKKAFTE